MSQVYQRTAVCDHNIKEIGERRKELLQEQQHVAHEITCQMDVLREARAAQERALQQQLAELVRAKEAELDAQHEDLERRRGKLVGMYREAEEYLNDGVHHKYEFIAQTHEVESKMDAHVALPLDVDRLDLGLSREVPYPVAARGIAALVFDVNAPNPNPRMAPAPAPAPMPQHTPLMEQVRDLDAASHASPAPRPAPSPSKTSPKDAVPNAVYVNGLAPD